MIQINNTTKPKEAKPFPKLMKLEKYGGAFFFPKETECFCIDPGDSSAWKVGEKCTNEKYPKLQINDFIDFEGSIQNA